MRLPIYILLVLGVGLLRPAIGKAQRVLLQSNVAQDTTYEQFGPNRAIYSHLYFGYLPVVGRASGAGAKLRYGSSAEYMIGVRTKFRLSEPLSVGIDLRFVRLSYDLAQTAGKILPTPDLHHRESLAMSQVQLEGFVRFNVGQRGNVIGRYLDLTGWGGWALSTAHRYEDRPANGPRKIQVAEKNLPYLRRWPYGVGARIGASRYAAVARYRLSDTFTSAASARYPELPRWTVGVELSWL